MSRSRLFRTIAIATATLAVTLFGVTSASAAAPIKPSPSCKVPVLTVSQTTAMPGTQITVSGVNFSGCSAQGNPAKPTAVLTVKVGVLTAAKVTEVLATTKTSSAGSFSVKITVPTVPAGGQSKIALAAESLDPVTKLAYAGVAAITYTIPTPTTAPSSTSSSSSEAAPTAVPAGSGGFGAPTGGAQIGAEIIIAAIGTALMVLAGFGLVRRRARQH